MKPEIELARLGLQGETYVLLSITEFYSFGYGKLSQSCKRYFHMLGEYLFQL